MDKVDIVGSDGQLKVNDALFVRAPQVGERVQAPNGQWADVVAVAHQPGPNAQVAIKLGPTLHATPF